MIRAFVHLAVLATVGASNPNLTLGVDRRGMPHPPFRRDVATALYFGGPVISNAKVVVVWWGDPANLDPAITAPDGGAPSFFAGALNSSFMDWLNEYNTTIPAQAGTDVGDAGSGQRIGRGNYQATVALTGVPVTGTVSDTQIQSALVSAIASGAIPAADDNSVYAVFFPPAVTISAGGVQSCTGFGGYHGNALTSSLQAVYYMVIPDCGTGNDTIVDSHELAEAVTDAIPTPGSNPNYPQAWNDSMGNEMGDLCETGGGTGIITTPVGSFVVQNIWDELSQSCVSFRANAQDFNVLFPVNAGQVSRGVASSFAVNTSTTAGAAQALTLSVHAPAGVAAILGATSLNSGQSTTVTINATTPATSTGLQVVVTATTGSGWTHTASLLLSVTGSIPDAGPPDAGSPTPDAGPAADAGSGDDAGSTTADAGDVSDAGSDLDAGGATDAGTADDAGADTSDAGPTAGDAGPPVSGNTGTSGCGCGASPAGWGLVAWLSGLALQRRKRRAFRP